MKLTSLIPEKSTQKKKKRIKQPIRPFSLENVLYFTKLQLAVALWLVIALHVATAHWNFMREPYVTAFNLLLLGTWFFACERGVKFMMYRTLVFDMKKQLEYVEVLDDNIIEPNKLSFIHLGSLATLALYTIGRICFELAWLVGDSVAETENDITVLLVGIGVFSFGLAVLSLALWKILLHAEIIKTESVETGHYAVLEFIKQTLNAIVSEGLIYYLGGMNSLKTTFDNHTGANIVKDSFYNFSCADGTEIDSVIVTYERSFRHEALPSAKQQGDPEDTESEMYQYAHRTLRLLLDNYFSKKNGRKVVTGKDGAKLTVLIPGVTKGGTISLDFLKSEGIIKDLESHGRVIEEEDGLLYISIMQGAGRLGLTITISNVKGDMLEKIEAHNVDILEKAREMVTEAMGVEQIAALPDLQDKFGVLAKYMLAEEIGHKIPHNVETADIYARAIERVLTNIGSVFLASKDKSKVDQVVLDELSQVKGELSAIKSAPDIAILMDEVSALREQLSKTT